MMLLYIASKNRDDDSAGAPAPDHERRAMTKKKRLRKEQRRKLRHGKTNLGEEYVYIIGVGSTEDWDAGRGSLYYIEDKNGETALPIFTTPERVEAFGRANFDTPEAYMQMLESLGANVDTHAAPLQSGRYIIMPVNNRGLALAAARIDADYLVRDPRPGAEQEVMRLKDVPGPS